MRTFVVASALVVVTLVVLAASSSAVGPIGVKYDWEGPDGLLSVANAPGQWTHVFDSQEALVFAGVAGGEQFDVMVPNAGPHADGWILRVIVGGQVFLLGPDDDDWIWE